MSPGNISAERRLLLEYLRSIRNGLFEEMQIRAGEPQLDPAPTLVHVVRFGRQAEGSPEITAESLMAQGPVVEMFDFFTEHRDCDVIGMEISEGIPVWMEIRESPSQIQMRCQP